MTFVTVSYAKAHFFTAYLSQCPTLQRRLCPHHRPGGTYNARSNTEVPWPTRESLRSSFC